MSEFRPTCVKPSARLIALWAAGDDAAAEALPSSEKMCGAPSTHCLRPYGSASGLDRSLWTVWCAEHVSADLDTRWTPLGEV